MKISRETMQLLDGDVKVVRKGADRVETWPLGYVTGPGALNMEVVVQERLWVGQADGSRKLELGPKRFINLQAEAKRLALEKV